MNWPQNVGKKMAQSPKICNLTKIFQGICRSKSYNNQSYKHLFEITMRYLLGFDVGSSSVKASLVNADNGKCVASAFFPEKEAPIMAAKTGWAEQ